MTKKSNKSKKIVKGGNGEEIYKPEVQILVSILLFAFIVLFVIIPRINKFNEDKKFVFMDQLDNGELVIVPSKYVKFNTEVIVRDPATESDIKIKVQDLPEDHIVLVPIEAIHENFRTKQRVLNPRIAYTGSDEDELENKFVPCSEEIFDEVGYLKSVNCVSECKKIGMSVICS